MSIQVLYNHSCSIIGFNSTAVTHGAFQGINIHSRSPFKSPRLNAAHIVTSKWCFQIFLSSRVGYLLMGFHFKKFTFSFSWLFHLHCNSHIPKMATKSLYWSIIIICWFSKDIIFKLKKWTSSSYITCRKKCL